MSAELHAAKLVQAVRRLCPEATFVGVGGEKLAAQGVELVAQVLDQSAMTYQAVGKVGYFVKVIRRASKAMKSLDFDAAVFVDSPALHFPMARRAKNYRIPSLYYIAPPGLGLG